MVFLFAKSGSLTLWTLLRSHKDYITLSWRETHTHVHARRSLHTFRGVLFRWIPTHQESWSRWESGIAQSEGGCSLNWSSVCLNFPGTQIRESALNLADAISLGRETRECGTGQNTNPEHSGHSLERGALLLPALLTSPGVTWRVTEGVSGAALRTQWWPPPIPQFY